MNDTAQIAKEYLSQAVRADSQLAHESTASKITGILLKFIVAITGVGIGGFIGLIVAVFAGLIEFRC